METLISANIIVIILGGTIIMGLVNVLKSKFPKLNPQIVVAVTAISLGIIYQLFSNIVPVEMRESVINFALQTSATSVMLY